MLNRLAALLAQTDGAFWTTLSHTEDGIPYLDVFARDRKGDIEGDPEDAIGAAILMTDEPRLRTYPDRAPTVPLNPDHPIGIVPSDVDALLRGRRRGHPVGLVETFASPEAAAAWLQRRVRWAEWRQRQAARWRVA